MAAIRRVAGVQREIWEDAGQAGGPPQVIHTGIRISTATMPRVRGLLVITGNTGALMVTAVPSISSTGHLDVTVNNGFVGTTIVWLLDISLVQSQIKQMIRTACLSFPL